MDAADIDQAGIGRGRRCDRDLRRPDLGLTYQGAFLVRSGLCLPDPSSGFASPVERRRLVVGEHAAARQKPHTFWRLE